MQSAIGQIAAAMVTWPTPEITTSIFKKLQG